MKLVNSVTQQINMKEIERKTYRDAQQDGLTDLLIGIGMIAVVGIVLTPSILKLLWYLPILLLSRIGEAIKRRVTYPRIGHVKFQSESPKKVVGGIFLVMLILFAIMVVVFTLFGNVRDFDLWMKWLPAFCGTMLVGLFLDLGAKSGLGRYYGIALLSIISGFSFALIDFNIELGGIVMYFLSMGLVMVVTGIILLYEFIRKNPLPEEAEGYGE